jgi:hypothetical protein
MNNYLVLYNKFFDLKSKYKVNQEELFLYAYLYRNRVNYKDEWKTKTNIYLIDGTIQCKFGGKKRERKDLIKSLLISLEKKKIISCNVGDETKNGETIEITFNVCDKEGYNKRITYEQFDLFDDVDKFYVYCYVDCFGEQGRSISVAEWAKLLDCSTTLAKKIINEMCEEKNELIKLYKIPGEYIDEHDGTRQEKNRYYTRPDYKTLQVYKDLQRKNNGIFNTVIGDLTVEEIEDIAKGSAWGKIDDCETKIAGVKVYERIRQYDYDVYRVCKDFNILPKFVKKCERIIQAKKESGNYDGCFDVFEKKYLSEKGMREAV